MSKCDWSSTSAVQLVTAIVGSFIAGIFIGSRCSSTNKVHKDAGSCQRLTSKTLPLANDNDQDSDLEDLPTNKIQLTAKDNNFKMVLVVRTDLGMTKGKIAAQCGHATLACFKAARLSYPEILREWEITGQAKVALKCDSEEAMLTLKKEAHERGVVAQSICDAGRTQIAAGSRTVLGIGPGPVKLIDEVTGHLKLL